MQNISNFAEKLDAESRRFAEWLHSCGYVYACYGILDSIDISNGFIRYGFDLALNNSSKLSTDVMHDWLLTPVGISVTALECLCLGAFSLIANLYTDKDKNFFKRYLAILWPYFRSSARGLRNSYKGMSSAIRVLNFYLKNNINTLIVPLALVTGVALVINRILAQKFIEGPRRKWLDFNTKLLKKVQSVPLYKLDKAPTDFSNYVNSYLVYEGQLHFVDNDGKEKIIILKRLERFLNRIDQLMQGNNPPLYLSDKEIYQLIALNGGEVPLIGLSKEQATDFIKSIKRQSICSRSFGLAAAAYGGMIDGLYIFMGVMTLSVLSPHAFIAMTVFSAFFYLACIGTRMFEEYNFQRRLLISEYKVRLAICGRELETLFSRLHELIDQQECFDEIMQKRKEFIEIKKKLRANQVLSNKLSAVAGLRNGLAVYNTLISIMVAYAALNIAVPPVLVISCISVGMLCVIFCIVHALRKNMKEIRYSDNLENLILKENHNLAKLLINIKSDIEHSKQAEFSLGEIKEAIYYEKKVPISSEHTAQTWAEVGRSLCSGVGKGKKSIDFMFNPLQALDDKSHYRSTPVMLILTSISALLYSVTLALRAFTRGFKPNTLERGGDDEAAAISTVGGRQLPITPNEISSPIELRSQVKLGSSASQFGIFNYNFQRSKSTNDLHRMTAQSNKVPDLM